MGYCSSFLLCITCEAISCQWFLYIFFAKYRIAYERRKLVGAVSGNQLFFGLLHLFLYHWEGLHVWLFFIFSWLLTGVMGFFWLSTHTILTAGLCLLFEMVRSFFTDLLFSCFRFCTWIGMTIMEVNLHRLISFRSSSLLTSPIILSNSSFFLCYSSIISCIYCFNLICSFGSGLGEMTSHLPTWVLAGTTTWTWFQRSFFPTLFWFFC